MAIGCSSECTKLEMHFVGPLLKKIVLLNFLMDFSQHVKFP